MDALKILCLLVERHNEAVATGDFSLVTGLFHPKAEVHFKGMELRPCLGRRAIVRAFLEYPPRDALLMMGFSNANEGLAHATYAWQSQPHREAGRFALESKEKAIRKITVFVKSFPPGIPSI